MSHVAGFVAAVPTANRETFRQHALQAAGFFRENGALQVVEGWGDDVPDGELTSFPMAVKRAGRRRPSSSRGSSGPPARSAMRLTRR